MADITEPAVKKFSDEVIRPMADVLVGINAMGDAETVTWTETILPMLSGYADEAAVPMDNADGRTPLTKKDLVDFVGELAAVLATLNAAGALAKVSKPHVTIRLPRG